MADHDLINQREQKLLKWDFISISQSFGLFTLLGTLVEEWNWKECVRERDIDRDEERERETEIYRRRETERERERAQAKQRVQTRGT